MATPKSNVFCPNCSAKNKIEQNFCRFCGLNLQETTRSLTAQLSTGKNARELRQMQLIKKITDYGSVALTIVVSMAFAFYAYVVATKLIFTGKRVLLGLFLISISFQFVMRQIRRIKRNKIKENNSEASLPSQRETAKLIEEKPFAPAASIAENSTELLFAENKTRKLG
jgi:hypothetical protein